MLSLGSPPSRLTMVPSASTASSPEHLRAHAPVAQHPDPARVGGDQAADRCTVAGREIDAEVETGGAGMGLQRSQPYSGAGGDLTGGRVDRLERVQPGQAEQHLTAAPARRRRRARCCRPGRRSALRRSARPQHRRDLVGVAGPHHERARRCETAGPVRLVRASSAAGSVRTWLSPTMSPARQRARSVDAPGAHTSRSRTVTGSERSCSQRGVGERAGHIGDDVAVVAPGGQQLPDDVDGVLGQQAVDGGQHARGVAVQVEQPLVARRPAAAPPTAG